MRPSIEASTELAAQELPSPPAASEMIEVDDIYAVDPLLRMGCAAANAAAPTPGYAFTPLPADSVEIELTAEQIDALLSTGA